jgi:hypothetical protein
MQTQRHKRPRIDPQVLEQKAVGYLKLVLILSLGMFYAAQWYQRWTWEHFRIVHACESTVIVDPKNLANSVLAWSCDDGRTYVR